MHKPRASTPESAQSDLLTPLSRIEPIVHPEGRKSRIRIGGLKRIASQGLQKASLFENVHYVEPMPYIRGAPLSQFLNKLSQSIA